MTAPIGTPRSVRPRGRRGAHVGLGHVEEGMGERPECGLQAVIECVVEHGAFGLQPAAAACVSGSSRLS